jgi:proline racemase
VIKRYRPSSGLISGENTEFEAIVIPILRGSTSITGIHQFIVENSDSKKTGWLL